MRVAVTGGTGFVGGHLARALSRDGHEVVLVARGEDHRPWAAEVGALPNVRLALAGIGDEAALARAFRGCEAVAHCAGINRETGSQTYAAVHVRGTANVVRAAEAAGVGRLALVSFLRARPGCGSGYHESKWTAEEIVRASCLDWTILKAGMMFGRGDHMLDHLSRVLGTVPVFVGVGPRRVRPLAVEDAVDVIRAALVDGRLARATVALVGPTELGFDDAARVVARVTGSRAMFLRAPLGFHRTLARVAEAAMTVPLVSGAQVRILEEEVVEPEGPVDPLPPDLVPSTPFDEDSIRGGLPSDRRFHLADLRCCSPGAGGEIHLATEIGAPRERCFDLARDIDLHARSQGDGRERAVAGVTTGLIGGGEFVSWRAWHFGVPWRMTSRISAFARPAKFVDEMESGPFRRWRHEHRFEDRGDSTLMADAIAYALPFGLLGRLADALFVRRYLTRLVEQHNRAIKAAAEDEATSPVAVPS